MWMIIRQVIAIVALPGVVTIAVPLWLARRDHIGFAPPHDLVSIAAVLCGAIMLAAGGAFFAASLFYFWTRGRGTLAPWDPPAKFVVEGPYRIVRNPMITGVILVLFGEACVLRSQPLALWGGLFLLINVIYIPVLEEPMLVARFGEPYVEYCRTVGRFMPGVGRRGDKKTGVQKDGIQKDGVRKDGA
jgi:protein-S-isoprenylcysteine O-methyltransferase Ste14